MLNNLNEGVEALTEMSFAVKSLDSWSPYNSQ